MTHLCLIRLDFGNSDLPFDTAQDGESFHSAQDRESFDPAQDREPVERPAERLVEPFRASKPGPRPEGGDSEGEFRISDLSRMGIANPTTDKLTVHYNRTKAD